MNNAGAKQAAREVAFITLRLYDDGAMGVDGNVGDVKLALGMMDAGREAVARRLGKPSTLEPHGAGLAIPSCDAPVSPNEAVYPLIAVGDRP